MKVLVTGGTGFIGRRLVAALLDAGNVTRSDGTEVEFDEIVVADVAEPANPLPGDARIRAVYGDFTAPGAVEALVDADTAVVFHLAAIVSGQAEQDFDLGMRINLEGTHRLLDACRATGACPRLVFASSVAAYGGEMPEIIEDGTALTPQTSYGSQKAIAELLINDYSRKGFVDGRALRLPTIIVRPGRPNAAASSFASSIVREPLQGQALVCPVSADTGMWVLSPRRVVDCFVHAARLDAAAWGPSRAVALPGITVSVRETLEALAEVAGEPVAARVTFDPDPFIERIVYGWATRFAPRRAEAMGFVADGGVREIIEAFIEDELGGTWKK